LIKQDAETPRQEKQPENDHHVVPAVRNDVLEADYKKLRHRHTRCGQCHHPNHCPQHAASDKTKTARWEAKLSQQAAGAVHFRNSGDMEVGKTGFVGRVAPTPLTIATIARFGDCKPRGFT
jgi:hypothetical protein